MSVCMYVWMDGWIYMRETDRDRQTDRQSAHKGVNQSSKDVTQVQQQRPESPTVTLTWHACKQKVHKLTQRYILV